MSVRFVVDAQLPPALARFLAESGFVAEHVYDVNMAQAADTQIWDYARDAGAVIVTKDEDFAARRVVVRAGPQIVWVRIGNTTTPKLISRVRSRLPELLTLLERDEPLIELA